ncbi:MAG: transcription-repair coupling factor [Chloroflexaceae bacterium]|nr:transcription-repair coupling factor [Chloroflexaceae bacterium]
MARFACSGYRVGGPGSCLWAGPTFSGQLRRLVRDVGERLRHGEQVCLVTTQAARLQEMLVEQQREWEDGGWEIGKLGSGVFVHGTLSEGWSLPGPPSSWTLYTDLEIFGWRQRRPTPAPAHRRETSEDERAIFLRGLKPGDYVVHVDHGIAIYEGLLRRSVGEVEREYLNLRYAGGERLYVPVDLVDRVSRYIGAGDVRPPLTRLGTLEWELARRQVRSAVQDLAGELLQLYAQRKLSMGHAFSPDTEWQRDMEGRFPFAETDDQLRALAEVKADMEAPQPMDRLICGDVGFGKTEVALRAAFKAVQDNKQVALLVPTTVLAQQHYETFRQRLAPFPVTVEMLSRFRSAREQEAIGQRLSRGNIDIIIGTHRLLSRDVGFKDLGLLIIDEEQRFGVRHKERLKHLRTEVDVLTLTATPIPRTLHMSLAGLRDMSVIDTPPKYRVPIKTYVVPYNKNLVRDAIRREIERGGQVYFLHNRVQSIYPVADRLRRLVPDARIGVAHGQLEENQLEQAMDDFFTGAYDVLVCTTIIENGLDVPNANTIIIDNAPLYGLAQLYQLRGRVGRSTRRAYAYLLYPRSQPVTWEARQRLQAIQEATDLGAGFRIAMRDMEIRGVGNILGDKQSGHIAAVGYDLYSRLLEQAVQQIRQAQGEWGQDGEQDGQQGGSTGTTVTTVTVDERLLTTPLVTLTLPLAAYLPEAYIPDDVVRLGVYQRMVQARTPDAVHALRRELRDRFGNLPEPADHLMTWLHIKILALGAEVRSITTTDDELMIRLPSSEQVRHRLARRFGRDQVVHVGNQFVRLNRGKLNGAWVEKLLAVLEVMQPGEL